MNKKTIKLEIGGKERTFWLGLGFLAMLFKSTNLTLSNIGEQLNENPFKAVPDIMFISLKYGYDRVGAEIDFNVFEVTEWIDDAGGISADVVKEFLEAFGNSMSSPETESANPEVRKKTTKKKKPITLK